MKKDSNMKRYSSFRIGDSDRPISYIETVKVKQGVSCDVYRFNDTKEEDFAIVFVDKDCRTPEQKVLKGDKTIEGFISGRGRLIVTGRDGASRKYDYGAEDSGSEVVVTVGETMQWFADSNSHLIFYEICSPPYEEGRFQNIADPDELET